MYTQFNNITNISVNPVGIYFFPATKARGSAFYFFYNPSIYRALDTKTKRIRFKKYILELKINILGPGWWCERRKTADDWCKCGLSGEKKEENHQVDSPPRSGLSEQWQWQSEPSSQPRRQGLMNACLVVTAR